MEAVASRVVAASAHRTEIFLAAATGAAASALVLVLAPTGGDAAAHLYRTHLVREGVFLWDNLWFGGHYPLASYSVLYYLPAALIGHAPLLVAAATGAAALFAAVALHEWGDLARWPARLFAVLAAGPLFMGTYSYAAGLATALATLRLLQLERRRLAVVCAALTVGLSPLAFVFLCLALFAVALARRGFDRRVAAGLAAVAAAEALILIAFPTGGRYTFSLVSLASVVGVSALGTALALQHSRARVLAAFFVVWGAASVVAFAVPSPLGDNVTRLRAFVFPLMLLAALAVSFRPRWLAVGALVFAFAYDLVPYGVWASKRTDERTASAEFWQPALRFLGTRASPDYRVSVVPTFDHWEAYWLPRAGLAFARGWYRQVDIADNSELYERPLTSPRYRAWLRRTAVRYVVLANTRLAPVGADREAALLRTGDAGLKRVLSTARWTVYEVPRATPVLTGPAHARLDVLDHDTIAGAVDAAGTYRLRIRYTPYWRVDGDVCVADAGGGETTLTARRATRFALQIDERPAVVVRAAITRRSHGC